jgi:SulP family sulfate permease
MSAPAPDKHSPRFAPKLLTLLRDGYGMATFRSDALAGLTVAIVALPLAMALAVASGTTPDKGLLTAVVAGLLISALGGSRFQIGGPTGAFIPVVYAIIISHGYDGLVLATLMAGALLIGAGLMRVGTLMKYMPQPVITGFTSGIAVIIFASQFKDLLGLRVEHVPAEFVAKLAVLAAHASEFNPWALAIAAGSAAVIVMFRRWAPSAPGFLVAVIVAAAAVALFDLPVDTIGSRFGGIPSTLPAPALPQVSWHRMVELFPAALTIAFLAGVESLLSAVVADGMTGGRHRSNTELIAQGLANGASALFGGLPATGAIARTATNIRAGGRTPVAGMLHALLILAFMLGLSGLASYVPMPALAGVLVVVAWNMSEYQQFRHTLSAPKGDRAVLLATFLLTVLVDLTVAIEVGMVMAAFVFMFRMADVVEVNSGLRLVEEDEGEGSTPVAVGAGQRASLPPDVEVFQIAGPLFFGTSNRLDNLLDQFFHPPKVFILRLRLRLVPIIDASGVHALKALLQRCRHRGIVVIASGLQAQPRRVLERMQLHPRPGELYFAEDYEQALALARELVGTSATHAPATA